MIYRNLPTYNLTVADVFYVLNNYNNFDKANIIIGGFSPIVISTAKTMTEYFRDVYGLTLTDANDKTLKSMCYLTFESPTWTERPYVNDLFIDVIRANFNEFAISIYDFTDDEIRKAAKSVFEWLVEIMDHTYERYSTILTAYDALKTKLLDGVKAITTEAATGETRFNDTPQSENLSDGYASDPYATNINVSETGLERTLIDDRKSAIERLDDLRKMYANVMNEWLNEFDVFVRGVNYE